MQTDLGLSGDQDPLFAFSDEAPREETARGSAKPCIAVLSVDDDAAFQRSLELSLRDFRYRDAQIEFNTARSAAQAAEVLARRPDIALVLLDVMMESDDAGLRLVRYIREAMGNAQVRIVLVTGQPGMAPMRPSLELLDISDYWLKTELSNARLHSILVGNLRTWEQIRALHRARRGLQGIVEASNALSRARGFEDFACRMILELSSLFGVTAEGLVCVRGERGAGATIIGAAGRFQAALGGALASLGDGRIRSLIETALANQASLENEDCQVLFFSGNEPETAHTAAYLATGRPLDRTERELLGVFVANIATGLANVALSSRLDRLAFEDPLLSIPNANALRRAVEQALDLPLPRNRVLLLLDLDQYSESCVSLGVAQGNEMLKAVVGRLQRLFPPPCMLARLHEDTFAVLGPADLVRPELLRDIEDGPDEAAAPFIGVDSARLDLDHADGTAPNVLAVGLLLLKRAGVLGGGLTLDYEPDLDAGVARRFRLSRDLYHALQRDEIGVVFQTQVELATGRVVGAEALARWTRPDGQVIPPGEFIAIAEANGLIVPLGLRILRQACAAQRTLVAAGFRLTLAVNVSPRQLARAEFAQEAAACCKAFAVDPRTIELEITESIAVEHHKSARGVLDRLKEMGFPLAIDDFGTGYSSLTLLQALHPAKLKIDRSFVTPLGDPGSDTSITEMMVRLGQRMKIQVLAEGVETQRQAVWLREQGCHLAQGFLFARPEPLDALVARLGSR
ncbi:GGDEF/EAL domain-containing response regulator [Xanthobacter agilis]|uniref:EAL domain-containing protein (Putative c-di-GMP-specific phosphodiesterase class I)/GGDEF domain-containing protein n=1 Tax=Xanthobacter agilis TaxID=47492 RepID=A0ABU0LCG9_XANAG|nr:EAL domain-containing protein [Xanthobacter agilis]MDQ0504844.1 EAL domain-containing protein (putative c-di-GMP-specific phosphodiesterase class I)/GGDEF domain-containing protein [Xanthobacter agilis]